MSFDEIAGHWLRRSESVLYLKISGEGRVRSWNAAVPARTGYGEDELRGSDLRVLLAEGEAARILQAASGADPEAPRLVNFVDAEQTPLTFSCRLYPDGADVHIVGADLVDEWKRRDREYGNPPGEDPAGSPVEGAGERGGDRRLSPGPPRLDRAIRKRRQALRDRGRRL